MLGTLITFISSGIILFLTPENPNHLTLEEEQQENIRNLGYPFVYSSEEILTDEMIKHRIYIIYAGTTFTIGTISPLSSGSGVATQVHIPPVISPTSIERVIDTPRAGFKANPNPNPNPYQGKTKISRRKEQNKNGKTQCSIYEQNKAGFDELPDSVKYTYNLDTTAAKKALKRVWKNPETQKETLKALSKIDKGELLPRNEKDFKGFKSLKELKFSETRMLVQPGENGQPDKIVLICMRRDLNGFARKLRNKYK